MSSRPVEGRILRIVAGLIASINLCACSAPSGANAQGENTAAINTPAAAPVPAPRAETTADRAAGNDVTEAMPSEASGQEAPPERVHGQWRVIQETGAVRGQSMVGKTLMFDDTALGWAGPDGKAAAGCADPFYHIVSDASEVRSFSAPFKSAPGSFGLTTHDIGPLHAWECGDGDAIFGPPEPAAGSVFYPVGTDRLMMNWNGGNVLLLIRQR